MAKYKHGDDTGFGFQIPSSWPKWKTRCRAHKRSSPDVQCSSWAVRGMPTCRRHGSGGTKNAQLGLVRYLSWIVTGCPKDTPAAYARFVALACYLEMIFNQGLGNVDQRLRAAQWLLDAEAPLNERAVAKLDLKALVNDAVDEQSGAGAAQDSTVDAQTDTGVAAEAPESA